MLTARRLTELGRVAEVAPSPDGSWLAVAVARTDADDAAYVHDLVRVPVDGGPPTVLTGGPFDDHSPCFRDDGALLFASNRPHGAAPEEGEDRRAQVWMLPAAGGEPRRLTDEPLGVLTFRVGPGVLAAIVPVWPGVPHAQQREHAREIARHGPSVLRYREMPVRHWDHWEPMTAMHLVVFDAEGGQRRDLTPDFVDELRPEPELALSRDGTFAVLRVGAIADDRLRTAHLRKITLATGAARDLGTGLRGTHDDVRISPGGTRIACTRTLRIDDRCPDQELVVFEGDHDVAVPRLQGWDRWSTPAAFLDEDRLVVTFDDRGEVRLALVDIPKDAHHVLDLPDSYQGVQALPSGGFVALGHSLLAPPRPIHVQVAPARTRTLAELSEIEAADRPPCVIERVDTRASDGAPVDTRLIKPAGPGPFPTVVWVHGGPIGHFGNQWHWRWNPLVLVSQGYAVALPNPRGSTGYGRDFIAGIWGNQWGAQCYDDLMRVADVLAARDDVAERRMACMGGSFGGYMTSWIGGQTDRFAALVTHAGVYDFRAFYGSTDYPAFWAYHHTATPWHGEIDRYSPHHRIPHWTSPTLILHGERDYRVPVTEALALFEALTTHGIDAELAVFPDESHWILKPRNVRAWYEAVLTFLRHHLTPPHE